MKARRPADHVHRSAKVIDDAPKMPRKRVREGTVRKGGQKAPPTSARPAPPAGQAPAARPTIERVPIETLTPLEHNPRVHGARDLGYLEDVIQRVGASRSGVIDEAGVILAGNGMREASMNAGLREALIVDADGTTPVFVRRRGLTPAQKAELVVADNQAGQLATWDAALLQALAAENPDIRKGWTDDEWAALVEQADTPRAGLTDPDATPELRPTSIQPGDLFKLGEHRLICGSATDPATVARLLAGAQPALMVTDPPYGVEYDPSWRAKAGVNKSTKKLGVVANDDRADWREAWALFPGVVAYVWHGGLKSSVVEASLLSAGFELRSQIIWAKDRLVLSRGDYHWQHEPCWYAVRKGAPGKRNDDRSQATVWRIRTVKGQRDLASTVWEIPARDDEGHGHGTQKPVECMARAIRNHTLRDVYDPFVGSGTTIIAAEQLKRRCAAIELQPQYAQVAIDRWEAFTGQKAEKL